MPGQTTITAGALMVLVLGWTTSLACFPFFSARTAEESRRLAGTSSQEVRSRSARLFILATEQTGMGRRYHLALRDYLVEREPGTALRFSFDEEGGAPITVREKAATEHSGVTGQEVRILHRQDLRVAWHADPAHRGKSLDEQQACDEALDNVDGLPTAVLVDPDYREDDIAVTFTYRDASRAIRSGRLVLIPANVRRHPVLAQVNKLNYLWAVPADVVVVVGGWSLFLAAAPIVLVVAR
jgi:hypothetical protein